MPINEQFMILDDFHLQTLTQLGLTPNQSKLYLTLLRTGKLTGSAISKETELARQEVYRIISELHEIGLIEKFISSPTEFQAINIQEAISILMMEKAREIERTKVRVQSLIKEYSVKKCSRVIKEYKFHLVPNKKLVYETRERMFENAKSFVQLTSTNRRFSQGITHFFDVWERTVQRNVAVEVIIVGDKSRFQCTDKLRMLEAYSNFSVKFTSQRLAGLLIVDKQEAIVTLEPKVDLGLSPVLWTNHPEFLFIYQDYFSNAWAKVANDCKKVSAQN